MSFDKRSDQSLRVGELVRDLTAALNGWLDKDGEVIAVDGSHAKIRYPSGNERWKAQINLARRGVL
jgi:hypothetical protein